MAEFSQKRGKRRGDEGLGSMVDFLLANARLVLGVGGAAVLGIATLAVKRFIDRATSPRDEDDTKADSWKELSLLKATPHLQPRPPPAALSQPVLPLAPSSSAPGEWHSFSSFGVTFKRCSAGFALTDRVALRESLLLSGLWAPQIFNGGGVSLPCSWSKVAAL
ncbi:MIEF2 isoform 8 [Pongo abelii]|uniref:MIEF2 isoform 8 n=1 Tax=Pongo abelii TaxID=9601 RepID=A0A2J8RI94_PONAB|nr:MIEF2 isoform 8 [Pongo abelii]